MGDHFKIYTKTGDDGTTGLVGGNRVKKYHTRLDAYGTVDELNSWLGVIRSHPLDHELTELLIKIQNDLFVIGSKLASDERGKAVTGNLTIDNNSISILESAIDNLETDLPVLTGFILPGGTVLSGFCHVARTVCRRAERKIVLLAETDNIESFIIQYINRLSDFLFVLARKVAFNQGAPELHWKHD